MNAFISAFLAFATLLSGFFASLTGVNAPEDTSEFTPVLRFFAASDSHVESMGDVQSNRMQRALKLAYAMAEADEEYKSLDAALFVGDTTDNGRKDQFLGFYSAANSILKNETQLLAVLAQSHDGYTLGKGSLDYYSGISGDSTDIHKVINGFHFIGLSASHTENEQYSEYQREWLRKQLDAAVAEDPTKPVFVFHHEHVLNTVYGSYENEGWGLDYFRDILVKYPQVVDFSGHSHYPLNDPRSLWQGEFTAVGTGALYYTEFTIDDVRTYHPADNRLVVTFWVVEVDANNRIRLRGIDVGKEEQLVEYIIDNPADPANREYTPEKRAAQSKPPVFAEDAKVKLTNVFGSYSVKADLAASTDGMPIFLYRAYVYSENGSLIKSAWALPRYYTANNDTSVTINIGYIDADRFTVEVVAETAYGVQSAPVSIES